MFYRYEIRNNGTEDILYLYLNMAYEFSKDFVSHDNNYDLSRRTKNFVRDKNINFRGNKVFIVVNDMVVKTVDINDSIPDIEILNNNLFFSNDNFFFNIRLENNSIVEISLREYLLGALISNINYDLDDEVLKAICILYRTFVFKEIDEKNLINSINKYVIFRFFSIYKNVLKDKYDSVFSKLNKVISDTDCLFLTFNKHYTLPFIHYSNFGMTISDTKYPYLSSVSSLWDISSPNFISKKTFTYSELSDKLSINITNQSSFELVDINRDGIIEKVKIDNHMFLCDDFIELLNLNSKIFYIIINKNNVMFIVKGHGNFLGLSIFGANELAKQRCDYANILSYYFPKLTLNKYLKEIPH